MKNVYQKKGRISTLFLICIFAVVLLAFFPLRLTKEGGRYAAKAEVAAGDLFVVEGYDVEMNVLPSRKVEVREQITVRFLQDSVFGEKITMFYRSLPTTGARYSDIQASCAGNEAFCFDVVDNPDMSGFIDVECIGGVQKDRVWTYDISYISQPTFGGANEMTVDVIGFGWSVDLHNVTATVRFPAPLTVCKAYEGGYGSGETQAFSLSEDKKTFTLSRNVLKKEYNDTYGENMAAGITLQIEMEKGALAGYAKDSVFTENLWKLLLGAGACIALAVLLYMTKRHRDIVTTVHVKPPKGMTPLAMGKIIDGAVDNEDTTSMIYYFAHKGYLKIDLENEEDPELIRLVPQLPEECAVHEKTLFNGLFDKKGKNSGRVRISQLVERYYKATEKAKAQVPSPKPMYTEGSVWRFAAGWICGGLFAFFAPFFMGRGLGGGYVYVGGLIFLLPLLINLGISILRENYRYKWKSGRRYGLLILEMLIGLAVSALFIFCFANYIMSPWEKGIICLGVLLPSLLTGETMSRSEKYLRTLEDVLGFREFILVTEEDKIESMLQENPELYYEVLPYAQVLGITKEWTEKFEKITLSPPQWCSSRYTVFDYWLLNRCVTRSMMQGMAQAAMKSSGGGHIGRSGGGGGFGGFGGGGFGGGGGGAR